MPPEPTHCLTEPCATTAQCRSFAGEFLSMPLDPAQFRTASVVPLVFARKWSLWATIRIRTYTRMRIESDRARCAAQFSLAKNSQIRLDHPSKLSFGTGSTRLRLLRGNRTRHAHNLDLCKGVAQDAAQMQPRERMQLHQPTHGTLLASTYYITS